MPQLVCGVFLVTHRRSQATPCRVRCLSLFIQAPMKHFSGTPVSFQVRNSLEVVAGHSLLVVTQSDESEKSFDKFLCHWHFETFNEFPREEAIQTFTE